jgi:hypothetical protein
MRYDWKIPEVITNGRDVGTNSDDLYMQIKQNKRVCEAKEKMIT